MTAPELFLPLAMPERRADVPRWGFCACVAEPDL